VIGHPAAIANVMRSGFMSAQQAGPAPYQVEISGWDLNENFFVENTELEWTEEEKIIHVQHAVQQGDLVFVRLMGATTRDGVCPVAYEVGMIKYQPQFLNYEILLKQILPREHSSTPTTVRN
jgi:hypothetical protein